MFYKNTRTAIQIKMNEESVLVFFQVRNKKPANDMGILRRFNSASHTQVYSQGMFGLLW